MLTYATGLKNLTLAALLVVSAHAHAHNDSWFDTHPTPHGGQVRMAGPYHLELMPPAAEVVIYVTDHGDTAIPTAGWNAHMLVLNAGKKTRIALKPTDTNQLRGKGMLPVGAQAVLSVRPKAGEEYSARYKIASPSKRP